MHARQPIFCCRCKSPGEGAMGISARRSFVIAITLGAFAATTALRAQVVRWDGNGSAANQDWGTAANWFPNGVPGSNNDIIIDSTLLNPLPTQMTTSGLSIIAKSITFDN